MLPASEPYIAKCYARRGIQKSLTDAADMVGINMRDHQQLEVALMACGRWRIGTQPYKGWRRRQQHNAQKEDAKNHGAWRPSGRSELGCESRNA